MMRLLLATSLLTLSVFPFLSPSLEAQLPPLGEKPPAKTQEKPATAGKYADVNKALTDARAANKDKRFADAESLMLPVTAAQPDLPLPWIELGTAQIGLKKYDEAEKSFKMALGNGPDKATGPKQDQGGNGFYASPTDKTAVAPTATRASSISAKTVESNAKKHSPEIEGVSYSSLGEIYAKTGKTAEAEQAFDEAANANPKDAALYLGNETIYFFQAGNADAQLAAAEKALTVDPNRAVLYYFKGQAMVGKATIDPKTQKLVLPAGCAEAFRKYLALAPNGEFAADTKGILTSAGLPTK